MKQPKRWDLKQIKYNLHTFPNTNDTNDLEIYLFTHIRPRHTGEVTLHTHMQTHIVSCCRDLYILDTLIVQDAMED